MVSWTLFVGRDHADESRHDIGSTLSLSMLNRMARPSVTVEMASDIPPRDRPFWLRGTPTLVNDSTGERHTGFAAFDVIVDMAMEEARQGEPATKPRPAKGVQKAPAAPLAEPLADTPLDSLWESTAEPARWTATRES